MSMASKQKRKQRELRVRREKHLVQAREAYPKFIFVNEGVVSREFASAVRAAVEAIDLGKLKFDSQGQLTHHYLRDLVRGGHAWAASHALRRLVELSGIGLTTKQVIGAGEVGGEILARFAQLFAGVHAEMISKVHEAIFNFDRSRFGGWFPEQGFRVCGVGRGLAVIFQRVHCRDGAKGRYWEYMIPQQAKIGPREYRVTYTRHAWERITQRFLSRLPQQAKYPTHDFFHLGKVQALTVSGQRLLQYYYPIQVGANRMPWPGEVEGAEYPRIDGSACGSVISYMYGKAFCSPIGFEGDRVALTTALPVGYHPTPESVLLTNPPEAQAEEATKIRHDFVGDICPYSPEYMRGIHFFHANGIPQIFQEPVPAACQESIVLGHFQTVRQLPDFVETANQA